MPNETITGIAEGLDVEVRSGDLRDPVAVEAAVAGSDTVFHVAALYRFWAPDPAAFYDINVAGTRHVLDAARRREIDVVLVWRLDRWGRSVGDLLATLQELQHLGVGFVSLTEALDLTTPAGRAMAALLAEFAEFEREILRERVRAGLAHARQNGKKLGRPTTAARHTAEIRKLHRDGVSKAEIARRLQIGRTSVRRILG